MGQGQQNIVLWGRKLENKIKKFNPAII